MIFAAFLLAFLGDEPDRGPKWIPVEASHSTMRGPDGALFHVRCFRAPGNFVLVDDVTVRHKGKNRKAHLMTPSDGEGGVRWTYVFCVEGYGEKDLYIEKAELKTPREPKVDADCHRDCECPKCPQDVKDGKRPCKGCDECDGEIVFEEEYGGFARYRKCKVK